MSVKLDFKDVLIVPRKNSIKSRKDVKLTRKFHFKNGKSWSGVPIISSNMDSVTSIQTSRILDTHDFMSCFPKHLDLFEEDYISDNIMLSCGTSNEDLFKISQLTKRLDPVFICIDIANGHSTTLNEVCELVRGWFPHVVIAAGNVVTPDAVAGLIQSGADIVKVGIGSGSVCETRLKAGVGYPQFSAILECSKVAHALGGYIISDGGIIYPCDIVKAFGAGADFVMCGSMFAGHEESPSSVFYGMSSETAMNKHNNGLKGYRTSEGKTVTLKNKGPLEKTLLDIEGSIRSACTYTNSRSIEDLKNVEFVRVLNHHNISLNE